MRKEERKEKFNIIWDFYIWFVFYIVLNLKGFELRRFERRVL